MLETNELIKKYWWIVIIVIISIFFIYKSSESKKIVDLTVKSYTEQIKILNEQHIKEVEAKEKIFKEYQNKINILEKQYIEQIQQVEKFKKSRIIIVKKYYEDPKLLANKIEERYGLKYVPFKKGN